MNQVTEQIRQEFANENGLEVSTLNTLFESNEDLRRSYLEYYAKRYTEIAELV